MDFYFIRLCNPDGVAAAPRVVLQQVSLAYEWTFQALSHRFEELYAVYALKLT